MESKCKFYEIVAQSYVKLKCLDGTVFQGKTLSLDGYLNIALESVCVYEFGVQEPITLSNVF
ncbi:hypothetical protein COBT_002733, partial [Conglomerata obtusa]